MFNHRVMLALNDLLANADHAPGNTNFIVASQGQPGKGQNKAVICTSTNPTIMAVLLTLKDGFDELNEEADAMEGAKENGEVLVSREEFIKKLREKLQLTLTLLDLEKIEHHS